ncbi:uncharacterized protein LOC118443160 isoform X2 [Vespa mandarinia]|uniref:uncharacterized protein LOC118443160 isoform X2 n=1 Tax=Vespa mandarinia TaxID=7446 RepID=UPI001621F7FB|nr:uncharacterized protein LOC118443160 isoform X2 [Vespa mandarinia]
MDFNQTNWILAEKQVTATFSIRYFSTESKDFHFAVPPPTLRDNVPEELTSTVSSSCTRSSRQVSIHSMKYTCTSYRHQRKRNSLASLRYTANVRKVSPYILLTLCEHMKFLYLQPCNSTEVLSYGVCTRTPSNFTYRLPQVSNRLVN